MSTRLILAALLLAVPACTAAPPSATPGATAAASARSGASHAIVSPGTVAGAMAAAKGR